MRIVSLCVLLGTAGAGWAAPPGITFTELPIQSVDGLSYAGVTFGFTVGGKPSVDAWYGSPDGPGAAFFIQDPSLTGDAAGTLQMDFLVPTTTLAFGVSLDVWGAPLNPGVNVELFGLELQSLGRWAVDTQPLVSWSEGRFEYSGAPVRRAVLTFKTNLAKRFSVDNLTYDRPDVLRWGCRVWQIWRHRYWGISPSRNHPMPGICP